MLSKCANPECSETFRYLHQGQVFRLSPSPSVQATAVALGALLTERFWLCDHCAQEMTVVWDGARAKVAPRPQETVALPSQPQSPPSKSPQRAEIPPGRQLAAAAGHEDN